MTSLSIRIEKDLPVASEAGAVAVLHRVADEAGVAIRGGKRLKASIPASLDPKDVKRIDVDPGQWWVEATLPSGEVIAEEVTVGRDEEAALTLRPSERSPHEWLGWQHLVGNIEGLQTFNSIAEMARRDPFGYARGVVSKSLELHGLVPDSVREMIESTLDQYLPSNATSGPPEQQADLFAGAGEPAVRLCHRFGAGGLRGHDAWREILAASDLASPPSAWFRRSSEEGFCTYRFAAPAMPPARDFANVEWAGERYAVSLPLPWPALSGQATAEVELMVRMRPLDKRVQIGVAVLDSEFGTLAGMMTASTLPKARFLVDQAREKLFGKMDHPLAATAGGYVLVATGDAAARPELQGWIENLVAGFPSLPDGPVLEATRRLRYLNDDKCYDIAKAALFEAFERGIPYYSAGVAWLLDGLTVFADEDPEAKERMQLVHKVAQRLDVAQAFTVISLSDTPARK
jgi:hypothetical protein